MRNFPLPLVLHHALNPLVRLNMSISWCTLLSIIPPPRCYRGPRSRRVLLLSWNLQEILVTGAQVISARSSQPLDTALIGAQPRPNTGGDPVEARSPAFRHYVTSQPWSGHKYSVHQILCHSSLRSSHQPSVSLFPLASPRRLLECNATSVWKTSIRWNIYHSPSQSFVSGTRKLEDYHDTLLRTRSTRQ